MLGVLKAAWMGVEGSVGNVRDCGANATSVANAYKAFIVDVNVEMRGGRPIAYRVTNLQVIDLPSDNEISSKLPAAHSLTPGQSNGSGKEYAAPAAVASSPQRFFDQ
jgi:hypothetical protein